MVQRKLKVRADWSAALQALEGHSNYVYSMAFSPNSKQVVSGSWDNTVRLWDAVTGAALQTLEGHLDYDYSMAFSPDGKQEQGLFISNSWIVEEKGKILWLPPDYRATCKAVWNKVIVLGHSSEKIYILGFKEGTKLI